MSQEEPHERAACIILGRNIGTATGWDGDEDSDNIVILFYEFQPAAGIDLPPGDLVIDFDAGLAETHDENGDVLISKDIVTVLANIPRAEA